jgi:hypothetical protein
MHLVIKRTGIRTTIRIGYLLDLDIWLNEIHAIATTLNLKIVQTSLKTLLT